MPKGCGCVISLRNGSSLEANDDGASCFFGGTQLRPQKRKVCVRASRLSIMKLLITGGAGFIGSNVVHRVIDEPAVEKLVNLDCLTYAGHLTNLERVSSHPRYVFEKVDLRDKAATLRVVQQHRITHVMHLAAESHVD